MSNSSLLYNLGRIKDIFRSIFDKGFFHLFSANILIQAVGFGSQFFVAWLLTPEQLGQIKVMQTYFAVAILLSTFGFNTSVLKLCSEDRDKGEILFLYRKAIKYVVLTILVVLPVYIMSVRFGLISSDPVINKYFLYYILAVIPSSFISIDTSYLQAIKKIKLLSRINVLTKIFSVLGIIVFTYYYSLGGYIFALIFGYFMTCIFMKFSVLKLNKNFHIKKLDNPFKSHYSYSKIAFLTNLIGVITLYMDVFFINYFIKDKSMIGYYSFSLTLILVTTIYKSTVAQISIPYLSEKSNNFKLLIKVANKYTKLNIIGSLCLVILLSLFVPLFVPFLFGSKFDESITFFYILLFAWFFDNIMVFKGYTLFSIGRIKDNLYSSLIILFINMLILYVSLRNFGIYGLAYGKLLVSFLSIFIIMYIYKKSISRL